MTALGPWWYSREERMEENKMHVFITIEILAFALVGWCIIVHTLSEKKGWEFLSMISAFLLFPSSLCMGGMLEGILVQME